jgi:hypothetical protein
MFLSSSSPDFVSNIIYIYIYIYIFNQIRGINIIQIEIVNTKEFYTFILIKYRDYDDIIIMVNKIT